MNVKKSWQHGDPEAAYRTKPPIKDDTTGVENHRCACGGLALPRDHREEVSYRTLVPTGFCGATECLNCIEDKFEKQKKVDRAGDLEPSP